MEKILFICLQLNFYSKYFGLSWVNVESRNLKHVETIFVPVLRLSFLMKKNFSKKA